MRSWPVLTPRGWGAVGGGLGALAVALVAFNLLLLVVGTALSLFVLAELVLFGLSTRGFAPARFVAQRFENSAEVTVGAVGSMGLRLEYHGPHGFYAEIFDSHPEDVEVLRGSPRLVTWCTPGEELRLVYAYRARRRGRFTLGPTVVTAHDAFGFAFRVASVENPWPLDAAIGVPTIPSGPASFATERPVAGPSVVARRGMGVDFRSLREYQPEDDIRTVAWKRSARGKLYVREFEEELPRETVAVLDVGRRMGAGPVAASALDRAVEAAAIALRYAAVRAEHAGLLLFSDRPVLYVPPGLGSDTFDAIRRGLTFAAPASVPFDARAAFEFLTQRLTRPAHLLVFAAPAQWSGADDEAFRALGRAGHPAYVFSPDLPEMYPAPAGELATRGAAVVVAPERGRLEATWNAIAETGRPVFVYDRAGARELMTDLYSRARAYRGVPS